MLTINDQLRVPLRELQFTFARSSGPGGQNVNKVNSKATLRWNVVQNGTLPEAVRQRFMDRYRTRLVDGQEILISSQRFRDQGRNVGDCLNKLREMIAAVAEPPKKRKATRPSRAARQRRLDAKKETSKKKEQRRPPRWDA